MLVNGGFQLGLLCAIFLFFGHPHSQSFRRRPLGYGGQVGATRLETMDDWDGVHLNAAHFSNWRRRRRSTHFGFLNQFSGGQREENGTVSFCCRF
jgi:hypothetical protein